MAAVARRQSRERSTFVHQNHPATGDFDLRFPAGCVDRIAHRRMEARTMRPIRLTNAHQSITFSRRMLVLGSAQAAIGGLLIARVGWLSVAQNAKYRLLSESNRVQLIPVPPRRGWLIDRNGKPIAINRSSFRVDIIPQQLVDPPKVVAAVSTILALSDDDVERVRRDLSDSRGF